MTLRLPLTLLTLLAALLAACESPLEPPPTCPARARSYVALGSSSTEGAGASDPARTSYVALLHARLRAACGGVRLANLGRGGIQVAAIRAQLPDVARARPDVITILPLTDFKQTPPDEFRAGYAALLDELGATGATVFFGDQRIDPRLVCGAAPAGAICYSRREAASLAAKNRIVAELAATRPFVVVVPVLDQNVAHRDWLASDGLHPNDAGHADFANQLWPAIQRWTKVERKT